MLQCLLQISRQLGAEFHMLPGAGEPETEMVGMNKLSLEEERPRAIDLIAYYRIAYGSEVDANLMSAPHLQGHLEKAIVIYVVDNSVVGACLSASGNHSHPLSVAWVTPDGSFDNASIRGEMPQHHSPPNEP
jgi:hypothetical protein